jgi:hypothetical protein
MRRAFYTSCAAEQIPWPHAKCFQDCCSRHGSASEWRALGDERSCQTPIRARHPEPEHNRLLAIPEPFREGLGSAPLLFRSVLFFELAERFRSTNDPTEVKQLGDELGRFVFGE